VFSRRTGRKGKKTGRRKEASPRWGLALAKVKVLAAEILKSKEPAQKRGDGGHLVQLNLGSREKEFKKERPHVYSMQNVYFAKGQRKRKITRRLRCALESPKYRGSRQLRGSGAETGDSLFKDRDSLQGREGKKRVNFSFG